jgi:hypothetical protein
MYFEDLSAYFYRFRGERKPDPKVLNVGWLAKGHFYPKGTVSKRILNRILGLCVYDAVNRTMGFHVSPFLEPAVCGYPVEYCGKKIILGTAEIWVRGKHGITYAAPDLIYHYIKDCEYLPPQEFLDAVDSLPQVENPSGEEYKIYSTALLKCYRFDDGETFVFREETKALSLNPKRIEECWVYQTEKGEPLTNSELIDREIHGGDQKRNLLKGEDPKDTIRKMLPQISAETVENFFERNRNPAIIQPKLKLGIGQVAFEKESERLTWGIQSVEEGWIIFRKEYPRAKGYFSFSRVGFNVDRNEALVEIGAWYTSNLGRGMLIALRKSSNDVWVTKDECPIWMSKT